MRRLRDNKILTECLDDGCQNVPEGWAGRTSSYALPRGMTCRFYSTADCAGKGVCIPLHADMFKNSLYLDFGQFYTKDNIGAKNDDKLMSMKCKWIGWSLIG